MAVDADKGEQRLLILAPFGKDSEHLCKVLRGEGFDPFPCLDIPHLVSEISPKVIAILTTQEVLESDKASLLVHALRNQPAWSAIPVLAFYTRRDDRDAFQPKLAEPIHEITDISFLQRPVSSMTLMSAVRGAIRDRMRQYRTRDLLERLQNARDAAELANQSKSQFLANMSHEIRTPLGAIMGFADMVAQPETSKAQINNYALVIRRNSRQLLRIIDDILDLSKVEAGKISFEHVEFSLTELLSDFSFLMGVRSREKSVQFEMKAMTPLPEVIISDPTRIRQILMNIVGNAIKFTEAGRVDLQVFFIDGTLSFEVKDSGRGISYEQSKALFQPFIQADASTTRKFGGTGLGLALTKRLCEAMGGEFFLKESELDKGSTFIARIQAKPSISSGSVRGDEVHFSSLAPLPDEVRAKKRLTSTKILVVEDTPDNQELIQLILSAEGAEVDIAEDGVVGIEKATQKEYSLILMDIQMPKMDGIKAIRILREKGFHIPIIAFTAHAMKEERERCMEAGFSHFLAKPIEREGLLSLLENVIAAETVKSTALDKRILLVEDDHDIRELLSEVLQNDGYQVEAVSSGEDALSYLDSHSIPRMMLMDLTLPGMSGAEVMQKLNERKDREQMKIILASGWDDLAKRAKQLHADGFMRKPIDLASLEVKVAEVFRSVQ